MIGKKVVLSENVPLFQVKEILTERNKEGELRYEQQQAFDYAKKFAKITQAKGEKLVAELKKIEGLDEDFITKAVDIMPADIESARLISYKGNAITDEKLKQVVEAISKYSK
ncbi:MAG TPA: RNA polymerase Rpb4 family protein [archaeon]|nr:RNA polymerase Rpb4 family protein [archaeon]